MEDAIATFQQENKLLAPFDSKYDLFLKGEVQLTALEEKAELYFSIKLKLIVVVATNYRVLQTTKKKPLATITITM